MSYDLCYKRPIFGTLGTGGWLYRLICNQSNFERRLKFFIKYKTQTSLMKQEGQDSKVLTTSVISD